MSVNKDMVWVGLIAVVLGAAGFIVGSFVVDVIVLVLAAIVGRG